MTNPTTDPSITIALANSTCFSISVPGVNAGPHTLTIPFTLDGMEQLRRILSNAAQGRTRIGEAGSPTQHDLDQMLKAYTPPPKTSDISAIIDELDLSDLV